MIKAGHQNSPIRQSPTPIKIRHPLDFFGLIGCPQCGHFSAELETSLLQAGQVIRPSIGFEFLSLYEYKNCIGIIAHRFAMCQLVVTRGLLTCFGSGKGRTARQCATSHLRGGMTHNSLLSAKGH
jgi:hypothetical protein